MIDKRRMLTDREMYPEQFEELPYSVGDENGERKRSVRLSEIGGKGEKNYPRSLNRETSPEWNNRSIESSEKGDKEEYAVKRGKTPKKIGKNEKKENAKAYAMRVLAGASVPEKKLREKLLLKEYTEDEADEAIEYVKSFGYINDQRIAQGMVEKLAARHWGKFKIKYYLRGKGIDGDTVESLDFSEINFPAYCAELIKKYPAERRDAMLRAVKNAGYSGEDYRKAVRLLQEEE